MGTPTDKRGAGPAFSDKDSDAVNTTFVSSNPDHRTEQEYVKLDELYVDPRFQRGEQASEIARIVANFNPMGIGTLTVSVRDGENGTVVKSLLDGQQRCASLRILREKGEWEDAPVPATVHYNLSIEEEAALFLLLNDRRSVSALNRMKARITAKDPQAIAIQEVLNDLGIRLGYPPKGFNAVAAADRVASQPGGVERLRWSLELVKDIYDEGDGGCYDGRIIEAFAMLHQAFVQYIDRDRLVSKLGSVSSHVSKLLGAGRTRQEVNNGGEIQYHIAMAVIKYYNDSKRGAAKYPSRLPDLPRQKVATVVDRGGKRRSAGITVSGRSETSPVTDTPSNSNE